MQIEVGLVIVIGGFAIGYVTFHRNRDKDAKKKLQTIQSLVKN